MKINASTHLLAAFTLLGTWNSASLAIAADTTKSFNIEQQPLAAALSEFARQSDRQILFSTEIVDAKSTDGIKGNLAPEEALERILQGTGLIFRVRSDQTILVARPGETASLPVASKSIRLAQAGGSEGTTGSEAGPRISQSSEVEQIDEVLVTGTHIRGVTETAAPSITITREEIEETGYTKIEDIFRDLPQNLAEFRPESIWSDGSVLAAKQNNQTVSSISLRGLGAGSTLTLLNGERRAPGLQGRAVDTSAIPLSMVERVEILTGGASAIYGSDAVAGVVNVITRRNFEGMETQFSVGDSAHRGGERMQVSHVTGATFERGGFAIGYDYTHDKNLDLLDTGAPRYPSRTGNRIYSLSLQPELTRHAAMFAGQFDVNDRLELYADGMYTRNDNENRYLAGFAATGTTYSQRFGTKTDGYSAALGARGDIAASWALDVSAVRAVSEANYLSRTNQWRDSTGLEIYRSINDEKDQTTLDTVSAVLDGPLSFFTLNGLTPRAAIGVDHRKEDFDNPLLTQAVDLGSPSTSFDEVGGDRTVRSAFAELSLPVIANGSPGLRRLELSYGARYDEYSDFGSAVNHQGGVIWQPADSLTVRGTYSTAYRAPELWYIHGSQGLRLQRVPDPTTGANAVVLLRRGNGNSSLTAEEATTWSVGLDWSPTSAPWAKLSLSYFDIDYTDRIDRPISNIGAVLAEEANYVDLIDRRPTLEELQAILGQPYDSSFSNQTGVPYNPAMGAASLLSLFPNIVVVDARTTNVAVEHVRGLDFQIDARLDTERGELSFGLNSTYSLDHERSITRTSPAFDMLNRVGKPVDFRVRATTGWTQGAFGAFLGINYVDNYTDDFSTTAAQIDSWTTVDLSLRLIGSKLGRATFLEGVTVSLSADNLLDETPPTVLSDNEGMGYDSVNANAFGRLISMRVQKRW